MEAPVIGTGPEARAKGRTPVSPEAATPRGQGKGLRLLAAGAVSAGLLLLAHFPAGQGYLAWVALVPLLPLVRAPLTARRCFLYAWCAGLLFFVPVLQWLRVADYRMYFTWAALSLICSFYAPAGVLLVRRLDRRTRLPLVVAVPAVW